MGEKKPIEDKGESLVRFACPGCGQKLCSAAIHRGREIRCPSCHNSAIVPAVELASSQNDENQRFEKVTFGAMLDSEVFEIPQSKAVEEPQNSFPDVQTELLKQAEEKPAKKEKEDVIHNDWSILRAVIYPMHVAGLINCVFIAGVTFVIDKFGSDLPRPFFIFYGLLAYPIRFWFFLYLYWYFADCARHCSEGILRMPLGFNDLGRFSEMFWQMINIVSCCVIFLGPYLVYVVVAGRTDVIFWLLLLAGTFYFPMALLEVIVCDAFPSLNFRLLTRAIKNTFWPYMRFICVLLAILFTGYKISKRVEPMEVSGLVFKVFIIYMLLVVANLLGRFYRRNKNALRW